MRRRLTLEGWIILICALVFLGGILFALVGCKSSLQNKMQVIWHDGKCLLYVDGLSAETAKDISHDWNFNNCEIRVTEEAGSFQKEPEG